MKKFLTLGIASLLASGSFAQQIDKIITKPYVDGLIKTLASDDMQGRMTFSEGIDKAATFIESEFKSIGLKPLPGSNSFRQTFYRYEIKPKTVNVTIDGETIAPENIAIANNTATQLTLTKANSDGWIKIDPTKDFISQYRSILRNGKSQLVLVDIIDIFNRLKDSFSHATSIAEQDLDKPAKPIVFVLDKDTVASNFSATVANSVQKKPLFNVVGVLPGKSKAKELVLFTGHYDHLGIAKSVNGDTIMNGADDDASGTTAVIALAKYYKQLHKNERTLIFAAFTAEEIGGFGSQYFSQQFNPNDVVTMFNIEMIGKDSKFGKNTAFITGYDKSDFGKILQKNLEGSEFSFHPDPYPEQNLFYRSDNATLAALGVPAHTISTDQIDNDKLYHSVDDEYESLDVENILSTIKAIAKSATSIVNGTDTPTRIAPLKQ